MRPHTLPPCSRLRSFTLRAHTTIYQITRLYASSIYPLQVKFTRDRLIGRHSYGLTNLSRPKVGEHCLNLDSLMVCKIFQLHRLTSLSFCYLAAHLRAASPAPQGPYLIMASSDTTSLQRSSQQFSSFYLEWNFMTTDTHSRTFTLLMSVSRLNLTIYE